jgi:hypothetical protein
MPFVARRNCSVWIFPAAMILVGVGGGILRGESCVNSTWVILQKGGNKTVYDMGMWCTPTPCLLSDARLAFMPIAIPPMNSLRSSRML